MTQATNDTPGGAVAAPQTTRGRWPLIAIVLLSFPSGLPLGLVWTAIPTWMAFEGHDIRVVGLFTLAQAPWSLKPLWAPFIDRFSLPGLGGKRGWVLLSQVALLLLGLGLSVAAPQADNVWLIAGLALAIALASATQDIAYDGYAVDVLRREEYGSAAGLRTAVYKLAYFLSARLSITAAAITSWLLVHGALAALYLPFMYVTWRAPEPTASAGRPQTLRQAVWRPFVGFLGQHRALEILAFVVLYKLSDNLTQALTGAFLVQLGYNGFDVGLAIGIVGLAAATLGVFVGAKWTERVGLGRALWTFGFLQIISNLGYAVVAEIGINRPVMYLAQAFEQGTTGLGTGAFAVLLLRLTQKRFSATQYALLSSLFALPRIISGPVVGLAADAIGWRNFFILTVPLGVPGLLMLARFVPWGVREPEFHVAAATGGRQLSRQGVTWRATAAGVLGVAATGSVVAALAAAKVYRQAGAFPFATEVLRLLRPGDIAAGLSALGVFVVGMATGVAVAAALVARQQAGDGE